MVAIAADLVDEILSLSSEDFAAKTPWILLVERASSPEARDAKTFPAVPRAVVSVDSTLDDAGGSQTPRLRLFVRALLPRVDGGQELVLGRADDCDIVIPDVTVSKHHLRFHVGERWVSDLGSRNGTKVAGRPLVAAERAEVQLRDELKLGSFAAWLYDAASAWQYVRLWCRLQP